MRTTWRRGTMAAIFTAAAVGVLASLLWPQPVPVDLAAVGRGPLRVTVDGEGKTRVKDVFVVSAPLTGRVLRITGRVGDKVVAGETVLAIIQPSDPGFLDLRATAQAEARVRAAEASRALAEAEQRRAEAELDFARADLERTRTLAERGAAPGRSLERAELEVKTREAALATAEATLRVRDFELETARAALINPADFAMQWDGNGNGTCSESGNGHGNGEAASCVRLRAPISGRILKVLQESESVVPIGTPLLELGDPGSLEIVVDLLSTDAVKVAEEAEVTIEEWGGAALRSRVRRVEPYGYTKISALGIEEQRVNVIADFVDPPEAWRRLGHGYRVEARIVVWEGAEVLKLPLGALFRDGDDWAVFVYSEGRAQLRRVGIGRTTSSEAHVAAGLEEGERVVLHPSDRVKAGTRIIPRRP